MSEVFTESFDQFSSKLGPTDLVMWGIAAFILYIVFVKDNVNIPDLFKNLVTKAKTLVPSPKPVQVITDTKGQKTEDDFFALIGSWKQTRDLADKIGCVEAVKVIDQMFPYLSPGGCVEKTKEKTV